MTADREDSDESEDGGVSGSGAESGSGGASGSGDAGGGEQGSHEKLARSLEKEADELEGRSQEVGEEISDTRSEWERKQTSDSVPGAVGEPDRRGSGGSGGGAPETEGASSNPAGEEGARDVDDSGQ